MSTGTLSYTCTNNDNLLVWSSTVWTTDLNIIIYVSPAIPPINVIGLSPAGITQMQSSNNNATCIASTLTFNGSLEDLTLLNNATLFCGHLDVQDCITIIVPGKIDARQVSSRVFIMIMLTKPITQTLQGRN